MWIGWDVGAVWMGCQCSVDRMSVLCGRDALWIG